MLQVLVVSGFSKTITRLEARDLKMSDALNLIEELERNVNVLDVQGNTVGEKVKNKLKGVLHKIPGYSALWQKTGTRGSKRQ